MAQTAVRVDPEQRPFVPWARSGRSQLVATNTREALAALVRRRVQSGQPLTAAQKHAAPEMGVSVFGGDQTDQTGQTDTEPWRPLTPPTRNRPPCRPSRTLSASGLGHRDECRTLAGELSMHSPLPQTSAPSTVRGASLDLASDARAKFSTLRSKLAPLTKNKNTHKHKSKKTHLARRRRPARGGADPANLG